MSKLKLYLSCPTSIPQQDLKEAIAAVLNTGVDVDWWIRGTKYDKRIKNYDGLILILPNFSWGISRESIPTGCANELRLAIALGKPIFLAYQTKENGIRIYNTTITSILFNGVAGSITKSDQYRILSNETFEKTIIDFEDIPVRDCYLDLRKLSSKPFSGLGLVFTAPKDKRLLLL